MFSLFKSRWTLNNQPVKVSAFLTHCVINEKLYSENENYIFRVHSNVRIL